MYVCAPHIYRSPQRSKEVKRIPWNWSCAWLWITEWVLGTEPVSAARTVCVLHHCPSLQPLSVRLLFRKLNSSNSIIRTTLLIPDSFGAGVGERAAGEHCYSPGEQIQTLIEEYSTIKSQYQPQIMTVTRKDSNTGSRSTQNFCPGYYLRPNIPKSVQP